MVSNFSTCFVSRSPIKTNDKVRLFFIASNTILQYVVFLHKYLSFLASVSLLRYTF